MKDKNLENCNFCKTILMMFVVLCHSTAFFGGNWFTICPLSEPITPLREFASWTGTFHVTGFTLISGYIYYHLRYEKGKYADFVPFIINKTRRLVVPYLAACLLWVIPISNQYYSFSFIEILNKFILGTSPMQLWFLLMLFVVFIIAFYIPNNKWGGVKIIIPLFIIGKIGMQLLPNYFQIFTALEYAMFFWIGCMIRKYLPNISTKKLLIVGGILLIVNLTSFYFTESFTGNSSLSAKILHMSFDILSKISGATMAFFLLNLIGRSINWNNTLFNQLSLMSFPIYLLHQQIIYVLLWNFHGLISPYLLVLINFIGSILLSSFISNLLMRTKYGRVIIGMK